MKSWEYRVEDLSEAQIGNQLNFIGSEGWELVWVRYGEKSPYPFTCFFKRPKESGLL